MSTQINATIVSLLLTLISCNTEVLQILHGGGMRSTEHPSSSLLDFQQQRMSDVCANSSRAKCIRCCYCDTFFSPNKFIFHYHRTADSPTPAAYNHPDAANFNSWRRHLKLVVAKSTSSPPLDADARLHAWEDVKAMFNGGSRRRIHHQQQQQVDGVFSSVRTVKAYLTLDCFVLTPCFKYYIDCF